MTGQVVDVPTLEHSRLVRELERERENSYREKESRRQLEDRYHLVLKMAEAADEKVEELKTDFERRYAESEARYYDQIKESNEVYEEQLRTVNAELEVITRKKEEEENKFNTELENINGLYTQLKGEHRAQVTLFEKRVEELRKITRQKNTLKSY